MERDDVKTLAPILEDGLDMKQSGETILEGRALYLCAKFGEWRGFRIAMVESEMASLLEDEPLSMFWSDVASRIIGKGAVEAEVLSYQASQAFEAEEASDKASPNWRDKRRVAASAKVLLTSHPFRRALHIAAKQSELARLMDEAATDLFWRSVTKEIIADKPNWLVKYPTADHVGHA